MTDQPTPYYQDEQITVIHGECIAAMNAMPAESVDSIVTDPPYGLGFMGKKWDALPPALDWAEACYRVLKPGGHIAAFGGTRTWHRLAVAIEDAGFEMRDSLAWLYGSGFPKSHDVSKGIDKLDAADERRSRALEFTAYIRESGLTAQRIDTLTGTNMGGHFTTAASQPAVATGDLFDLLRPHLGVVPERIEELVRLRTVESQNYASRPITQAEVRPLETGEVISFDQRASTHRERRDIPATPEAEQWEGWGTALKPAFEPIVLARKPLAEKTVARNVLAHGTGAINIDATRIPTEEKLGGGSQTRGQQMSGGWRRPWVDDPEMVAANAERANASVARSEALGRWPANVLADEHAAAWIDEQSGVSASKRAERGAGKGATATYGEWGTLEDTTRGHDDQGGASRFFYNAKAPKSERPNVDGVQHPTVKPLAIMRWLLRLTTPPGGVTLDPFAGSGTTVEAAILEGFSPIGIELTEEYLPLIQHRIDRHRPEEPVVWDAAHLDRLLEDMDELI